ncbi:MAG: metallophosphoesterase family protein [Novosphingobium sp.]
MNIFSREKSDPVTGQLEAGQRIYAIGDIHGEVNLLTALLEKIQEDNDVRRAAATRLIFLGDVVDRGPDPASILRALTALDDPGVVCLRGNHEQVMIDAYRGNLDALRFWLKIGGLTTLASFGVNADTTDMADHDQIFESMKKNVDRGIISELETWPTYHVEGTYFFTHAGVKPKVALQHQDDADLLWIRGPFLNSNRNHGAIVVHGHTVEAGPPALGGNRIGVDTGAHEFGRLTALGLEGESQWLVEANDGRDSID